LSLHFGQVIVQAGLSDGRAGLFAAAADGVGVSVDRRGAGWEK
jgi:hypothetical protein